MAAPQIDLVLQGFTFGTDQGSPAFCGVTLVRSTKTILVDVSHNGRRALLIEELKRRGLRPQDIDMVVLTHAHWDHALNIDLFPNAEVLIHGSERRYAQAPDPRDWATASYTGLILERHRLREVREGDEIDAGVCILDTPGHTPGSISLLVDTEDGAAAITGDALPNARCALQGSPYLVFYDPEEARQSVAKIRRHATTIYPGHDRPFRLDGDTLNYHRPAAIRITAQLEPWGSDASVTLSTEPPRELWSMRDQPPD